MLAPMTLEAIMLGMFILSLPAICWLFSVIGAVIVQALLVIRVFLIEVLHYER